ncbi:MULTISPECIES: S8 family serine peptidase [Dethiosulfovibrio]|uniref:S8 family serine peptidase n=2 Tax=Dethiosulfovibrio TaxID=47054 RepID=A0ABS9ERZ7_9BACT|nr:MULTISPECIES: S8 family serine peptidase [Dethiosulfovibrio]MCF4115089.1 S8 family serine peptidase [Dethiosulfovibrio russensis]MCF4143469.1 S8 family serine peptidase [Dethiosulfovibrio marinus]MCF4145716.1 S8 family serine peptidase [Dethiosulfovibrio acidaminovorans]
MFKKTLFYLFLAISLSIGISSLACASLSGRNYVEGEALVVLKGTVGTSASHSSAFKTKLFSQAESLKSAVGAESAKVFSSIAAEAGKNVIHVKAAGKTTEELLAKLRELPEVLDASPNYIVRASAIPSDPYYTSGDLWGMDHIKAPEAWDICSGDKSVVVAVIDTGVDYNHVDLAENIGKDLDGRWGYDAIDGDYFPMDGNGHGSHVAGTIGAVGSNDIGVVGVNWAVTLLPVRVLNEGGEGTGDQILAGLDYVVAQKNRGLNIKVANMSLGGWGFPIYNPDSNAYALSYKAVSDAGIVLVVAAGNEYQDIDSPNGFENRDGDWIDLRGQRPYPACFQFDNMITVAAIASDDVKADFSNYSPNFVHLAAPGVKIWSTVPGNSYDVYGGTSMATPHVAGAAALLAAHAPGLSAGEIKSRILANVTANSKVSGKVSTGGNLNLLDVLRGAKAVVPVASVVIPSAQKSLSLKEGGSVTLSVTVGPSNATNSMVAWSSNDPNVATVSGKGVVTAVKAGTATIYAKSNDGSSVSDSATVSVTSSFFDEGIGGGCAVGFAPAAAMLVLPLMLFKFRR